MTELLLETWVLPIRSYIVNEWNPRDSHLLIDIIEMWEPLLPKDLLTDLYDNLIFPKLKSDVEQWNPTQEKMMIHLWIHPWFPLLGEKRIGLLWKPIQFKLSTTLQQWHPSDKSALLLLGPWLRVFDISTWENLIIRVVLPKLMYALKDFVVNPRSQDVEPIKWLLDWADFIPQDHLVNLLENYLLKKMVTTLDSWVKMENAAPGEMMIWINGWKSLLGKKVTQMPIVDNYFSSMINRINNKFK